jgi:hypothetical protein
VGRLATYKYYNMDQVTAQALATFRKIRERQPAEATTTRIAGLGLKHSAVSFSVRATQAENDSEAAPPLASEGPEEKVA